MDKRWMVVVVINCVIMGCIYWVNHALSAYGLFIGIWSIFSVFAAVYLPLKPGFWAVLVTSLMMEGRLPMPMGTMVIGMMAIFCSVSWLTLVWDIRFGYQVFFLIQIMNIFFWSVLMVYLKPVYTENYWWNIFFQWTLSQAVLAIIGKWYCDLQVWVLVQCGCKLKTECRPL